MFLSKLSDPYNTCLTTRRPRPVHPDALVVVPLIDALKDLRKADKALRKAKEAVPNYTGQWSDKDYYADAEEAYNRAVEAAAIELAKITGNDELLATLERSTQAISPFQVAMSQKIEDVLPADKLTTREKKYVEGLTYLGDLVAKIDKSSSFNGVLTIPSWKVINAIPPRWGLEDWVRPE